MSRAYMDKSRLKLQMDKAIRELNRETINPLTPELSLEDIKPVLAMVARARAAYLNELFEISKSTDNEALPTPESIQKLESLRKTFEELLKASSSLQTAIERDYLDVLS